MTKKRDYRKMLYAKLVNDDEVLIVKRLCEQEQCSVSDLVRRAIASLYEESGQQLPEFAFIETGMGYGEKKHSLPARKGRNIGWLNERRTQDTRAMREAP